MKEKPSKPTSLADLLEQHLRKPQPGAQATAPEPEPEYLPEKWLSVILGQAFVNIMKGSPEGILKNCHAVLEAASPEARLRWAKAVVAHSMAPLTFTERLLNLVKEEWPQVDQYSSVTLVLNEGAPTLITALDPVSTHTVLVRETAAGKLRVLYVDPTGDLAAEDEPLDAEPPR